MTLSKRLTWLTALAMAAALLVALLPTGTAEAGSERTYRVTITNLTDGQPLTPLVVANHSWRTRIFRPWGHASQGLQSLAENGGASDFAAELEGKSGIGTVQVAGAGLIMPGQSVSVDVVSAPGKRFLSAAGMLVCTNDGFGAVNKVLLRGNRTKTVYGYGWDAGTEVNTEAYADLVPPCDGMGESGMSMDETAENGRIRYHRGIKGIGDLSKSVHGWRGPVIKVVIEPIG